MGKINDKLNSVFKEYKEKNIILDEKFTPDGILEKDDSWFAKGAPEDVEEAWMKSEKRILILLKDQPNSSYDVRKWLRDGANAEDNRELRGTRSSKGNRTQFLPNLGRIIWGLTNSSREKLLNYEDCAKAFSKQEDWEDSEVVKCFNTVPFAFVECKKECGGTSLSDRELRECLRDENNPMWKEIEILQPNMIVCTNVNVYNEVMAYFKNKGENLCRIDKEEHDTHNSIRYLPPRGILLFLSYHPSARKSKGEIYEGVLSHYNAFLQQDCSKDFKFSRFDRSKL